MLLQSFAAGAILARETDWLLLPALALAVLGFMGKEPLVVVIRHRIFWGRRSPEAASALRVFLLEALAATASLALLYPHVSKPALSGLAMAGLLVASAAVWLTAANRRRSIALQLVSAAGLCLAAPLAVLASTGAISGWAWLLWALLAAHGAATILIVHARLELRARARSAARSRRTALLPQLASIALAGAVLAWRPWLALPLGLSGIANLFEWRRLASTPGESLHRVGFRLLAVSIGHAIAAVACIDLIRGN